VDGYVKKARADRRKGVKKFNCSEPEDAFVRYRLLTVERPSGRFQSKPVDNGKQTRGEGVTVTGGRGGSGWM